MRANPVLSEDSLDALVDQISRGIHPLTIAKRMHPTDRVARRRLYRQLHRAILGDTRVAARLQERLQIEMMVGLGPTVRNLVRLASNNRDPKNIQLLLEATGFHNPKVQHQHSGEITIKMDIPRPTFEGTVVDADVVE
jgi:hypothetical protein